MSAPNPALLHPGQPCCQPGTGGCTEALKELMEPPAGAYVHPQEDAHKMRVGRVERKRPRGRAMRLSDIEAAVEAEVKGRSKL